jgi:hypothetical protein
MADVILIAAIVAFFALAALLVRACDNIIGATDATHEAVDVGAPSEDVPA